MRVIILPLGLALSLISMCLNAQVCNAHLFDFGVKMNDKLISRTTLNFFSMYPLTFCNCKTKFNYVENDNNNTDSTFSMVNCHLVTPNTVFPLKIVYKAQEMTLLIKISQSPISYNGPSQYMLGYIDFKPGTYTVELDSAGNLGTLTTCSVNAFYGLLQKDYEYKYLELKNDAKNWAIIDKKYYGGSMYDFDN